MSKYVKIFPINLISPSIFSRNIHTGTEVFRQFLDNIPDMLIINGGSFIHIFQSDIALLISFVYKNIKWGLTILATNFVSLFIRWFIFIIGQFLVPDTLSSFPWIAVEKKIYVLSGIRLRYRHSRRWYRTPLNPRSRRFDWILKYPRQNFQLKQVSWNSSRGPWKKKIHVHLFLIILFLSSFYLQKL